MISLGMLYHLNFNSIILTWLSMPGFETISAYLGTLFFVMKNIPSQVVIEKKTNSVTHELVANVSNKFCAF